MSETIYYLDILGLFLSTAALAGVASYIYIQNRKSLVNRVFSLILFMLSLSNFLALVRASNNVIEWVIISYRVSLFITCFAIATLLYFCIIFPQEKDISKGLKIALYIPAVFFALAAIFTNWLTKGIDPSGAKYLYMAKQIYGTLILYYTFYAFAYTFIGSISLIIYKLLRSTGVQRKKLFFLMFAIIIGVLISFTFTLLLRLIDIAQFDSLGRTPLIISAALVAYAIARYRLFSITPQVATAEILESLENSILVSDTKGEIIFQGNSRYKLDKAELKKLVNLTLQKGDLIRHSVIIDNVAFNLSLSFEGGVVVIHFDDMPEIEKMEKEKEETIRKSFEDLRAKKQVSEKLLAEITASDNLEEIKNLIRNLLIKDLDAVQTLEHIINLRQNRQQMLADLKRDNESIEKHTNKIEEINRILVQRELQMVDLKQAIKDLKGT